MIPFMFVTKLKKYLILTFFCMLILFVSACDNKNSNDSKEPNLYEVKKTDAYKAEEITEVIIKVNTYFQTKMTANSNSWDDAVYHSGNIRAYMTTGIEDFYNYSYKYAKMHHFLVNNSINTTNGDSYCISQLYIDLYNLKQQEYKIEDVIRNADYNAEKRTKYSWVDLLYMGSPVFSALTDVTGDSKYVDDAFRAYKEARETLWDEDDSLWYRDERFVFGNGKSNSVTPAGKKVFWSRGNGWAFAGLAKTLETLDVKHEAFNQYLNDFRKMAKSLKERQRDDGTWNANLDDPDHFGGIETSGTVMFMYGYAVGLKYGFLEYDEYFETLKKAFDGVCEHAISEEGRLLYVQPVADSPQMYENYNNEEKRKQSTKQYAVGIFVMAASELMSMCEDYVKPNLNIPEDDYVPIPKEEKEIDPSYYKGKINVVATKEQEGNEAINLVDKVFEDGDGNRWSADGFNNSATLEFESILKLKKIVVIPHMKRDYRYRIEASTDGINYTTVVDNTKNSTMWLFFSHDVDIEAKYLRLTVIGAGSYDGTWISINELLVYTK